MAHVHYQGSMVTAWITTCKETRCGGREVVIFNLRYYTNTVWLGPLMGFWDLSWHILRAAGSRFHCYISQSVLLLWTAWVSVEELL